MLVALAADKRARPLIEDSIEYESVEEQPTYYVDQNLNSWLYITLIAFQILSQTGCDLIFPFLPVEIEKKGIGIQATAFIFVTYNVSAIAVSAFTDQIMGKIGRRNTLLFGMFSEGAGYILLGFNQYIDNKPTYIGLAIVARIISGFGGSCIMTTIYSIVLNFYIVNQARALAFSETAW